MAAPAHDTPPLKRRQANTVVPVVFALDGDLVPGAREVSLLGGFNRWTPKVHRLEKNQNMWAVTIYHPPGRVLYGFDVDGVWWLDPHDEGRVPNAWGSEYSVRYVTGDADAPRAARPHLHPIRGGAQTLLECSSEAGDGAYVVAPAGEIDLETAAIFRNALASAVESGRHVVVDLSRLEYVDSTGLFELVRHHRMAQEHKRQLVLASPSRLLAKLLRLTNLSDTLAVFPTVNAALAALPRHVDSTAQTR